MRNGRMMILTPETARSDANVSQKSLQSLSFYAGFSAFLRGRTFKSVLAAGGAALSLAGCAHSPQPRVAARSKEYFPSSVYGKASPRVIADGQPIPRGGGTRMVGKPYTVAGHTYYPSDKHDAKIGLASWYGDAFHGRLTANGEIYDREAVTAASPTMPIPSYARVTNLRNHYSMVVRVNDRGPFASDRIMDVSHTVARALDFHKSGTAKVKVEYLAPASLNGSDDKILLATLRQDGRPAGLGGEAPVMVAENPQPARAAVVQPTIVTPTIAPPRVKPLEKASTPSGALSRADAQALAALAAASLEEPVSRGSKSAPHGDKMKPVPPSRPFDLATIPGAGVAISASPSRHAALR